MIESISRQQPVLITHKCRIKVINKRKIKINLENIAVWLETRDTMLTKYMVYSFCAVSGLFFAAQLILALI
ncbi:MAG: hypothetical protein H0Z40_05680 [Desulfotomaculum sp.]|nr:hypothetical protein [Desulfotomaculum sp.]